MKNLGFFLIFVFVYSCSPKNANQVPVWNSYDQGPQLTENKDHRNRRMRYKLIQSKFLDKNDIWAVAFPQIKDFSEQDYQSLKPFILEQDISDIQSNVSNGKLTYEKLTKWYLYRIVKYENNPQTTLHSIISINPNAVKEARKLDKLKSPKDHPIYGMPILLKDNINTKDMNTTAGAVALINNKTDDAFIVERLKGKGAIVLGKANLSEWAYFFCGGCPVGYSAVGGQTLNPYGRRIFETGGSSSGSGTSMAANYAAAAVGTETSGSILSPSSANSVVGLKPTIGLLSRSGIVPISSTLDTPGPMTRSVMDNAIFLSALSGEDPSDSATKNNPKGKEYWKNLQGLSLGSVRLGANKAFMERDSIYAATIDFLRNNGANIIEFDPESITLNNFQTLLNLDMKVDVPAYLNNHGGSEVKVKSVSDVVTFNRKDTSLYAPYGQARLEGLLADKTSKGDFLILKDSLQIKGRKFFDTPMDQYNLDAVLSINNYNAGHAAVAKYPALTIPMGYRPSGQPVNLTFIGKTFTEKKLLRIAYTVEQLTKIRKMPAGYQ